MDETAELLFRAYQALNYAIKEADGWHDDCRSGPVRTPEMRQARQVLAELKRAAEKVPA